MDAASGSGHGERHNNAFGLARLLLAIAVVFSHTPEIIDGDRHREPLVYLFGTISLGDLAVDGFFLVSGYLITRSFLDHPKLGAFLLKRAARIYPAFTIATLISLAAGAPLAGARFFDITSSAGRLIARSVALQRPELPGVFAGTLHPSLNNPMWTIAYEFRCYLLIPVLGAAGVLQRPRAIFALAMILLAAFELGDAAYWRQVNAVLPSSLIWLGFFDQTLRFTGLFLFGALFFLWRDAIPFNCIGFALSACGLTLCLFVPALAEPGAATFGGYLLIGAAVSCRGQLFSRINNRTDISYGLYLYAWPISKLLLWSSPAMSIAVVNGVTVLGAALCGLLSWHLVEKPILSRWRRAGASSSPRAAQPALV
ncbi:acyltransferase [Sphingomonas sp. BIUV-7]|uniref:Acyltransferase n=1 Tax=Sphingomonas natans TaxID=3063330 RepID=A0ABT8YCI2_9SPHN|nr:acyltransferase [Sphingomonas sp. BIUV-7]MDO6416036.1 acyltransferase [Sphingomonas sp. BIUV-7]